MSKEITPISLLEDELKFHSTQVKSLMHIKEPSKPMLEMLEKSKKKVKDFQDALEILREHLGIECEHTPMEYGQLTLCSKCNKML